MQNLIPNFRSLRRTKVTLANAGAGLVTIKSDKAFPIQLKGKWVSVDITEDMIIDPKVILTLKNPLLILNLDETLMDKEDSFYFDLMKTIKLKIREEGNTVVLNVLTSNTRLRCAEALMSAADLVIINSTKTTAIKHMGNTVRININLS